MAVGYHTEECAFRFRGKVKTSHWIVSAVREEGKKAGAISIVFCSDGYILDMNRKYLGHDYRTDIITFDYGAGETVSGDLFIGVETVRENAEKYGAAFGEELARVMIHGVMHLCGYGDKTPGEAAVMRRREDYYLGKLAEV